ncbi:uncharacterized protein LOC133473128, partial [Phyllopteryx taeniolatus]|uniref:uncharacterized protein LOC133473128 n=1 Tax=Phyllopteryx taeniolatus TaxID=161469 RepID=UPI002AD4DB4F
SWPPPPDPRTAPPPYAPPLPPDAHDAPSVTGPPHDVADYSLRYRPSFRDRYAPPREHTTAPRASRLFRSTSVTTLPDPRVAAACDRYPNQRAPHFHSRSFPPHPRPSAHVCLVLSAPSLAAVGTPDAPAYSHLPPPPPTSDSLPHSTSPAATPRHRPTPAAHRPILSTTNASAQPLRYPLVPTLSHSPASPSRNSREPPVSAIRHAPLPEKHSSAPSPIGPSRQQRSRTRPTRPRSPQRPAPPHPRARPSAHNRLRAPPTTTPCTPRCPSAVNPSVPLSPPHGEPPSVAHPRPATRRTFSIAPSQSHQSDEAHPHGLVIRAQSQTKPPTPGQSDQTSIRRAAPQTAGPSQTPLPAKPPATHRLSDPRTAPPPASANPRRQYPTPARRAKASPRYRPTILHTPSSINPHSPRPAHPPAPRSPRFHGAAAAVATLTHSDHAQAPRPAAPPPAHDAHATTPPAPLRAVPSPPPTRPPAIPARAPLPPREQHRAHAVHHPRPSEQRLPSQRAPVRPHPSVTPVSVSPRQTPGDHPVESHGPASPSYRAQPRSSAKEPPRRSVLHRGRASDRKLRPASDVVPRDGSPVPRAPSPSPGVASVRHAQPTPAAPPGRQSAPAPRGGCSFTPRAGSVPPRGPVDTRRSGVPPVRRSHATDPPRPADRAVRVAPSPPPHPPRAPRVSTAASSPAEVRESPAPEPPPPPPVRELASLTPVAAADVAYKPPNPPQRRGRTRPLHCEGGRIAAAAAPRTQRASSCELVRSWGVSARVAVAREPLRRAGARRRAYQRPRRHAGLLGRSTPLVNRGQCPAPSPRESRDSPSSEALRRCSRAAKRPPRAPVPERSGGVRGGARPAVRASHTSCRGRPPEKATSRGHPPATASKRQVTSRARGRAASNVPPPFGRATRAASATDQRPVHTASPSRRRRPRPQSPSCSPQCVDRGYVARTASPATARPPRFRRPSPIRRTPNRRHRAGPGPAVAAGTPQRPAGAGSVAETPVASTCSTFSRASVGQAARDYQPRPNPARTECRTVPAEARPSSTSGLSRPWTAAASGTPPARRHASVAGLVPVPPVTPPPFRAQPRRVRAPVPRRRAGAPRAAPLVTTSPPAPPPPTQWGRPPPPPPADARSPPSPKRRPSAV